MNQGKDGDTKVKRLPEEKRNEKRSEEWKWMLTDGTRKANMHIMQNSRVRTMKRLLNCRDINQPYPHDTGRFRA